MAEIDLGDIGGPAGDTIDLSAPKRKPVMTTSQEQFVNTESKEGSKFGRFMGGVGYGMEQTGLQLASLLPFTGTNALRGRMAENEQVFNMMRDVDKGSMITPAGLGNFTGQVAATAPLAFVPGGASARLGTRMLSGAGVGAVAGALQPSQSGMDTTKNMLMGAGLGAPMGAAMPYVDKFIASGFKKLIPREETLGSITEYGMSKAAKPAFTGQQNTTQRQGYFKSAQQAITYIVEIKSNLQFTNTYGEAESGRLPTSLVEFADSIHQTKTKLFDEYNNLVKEATGGGVSVPVDRAISVLEKEAQKEKYALHGEFKNYVKDKVAQLREQGAFTPSGAQDIISDMNNSLKMYYSSPSKQTQGQAAADILIAGALREELNNTMEAAGRNGYQQLKNRYGALATIEKDVNRQTAVNNRRVPAGLFDITDTYSAQHAAMALMKGDPAGLVAAGAAKGVKDYLKWLNNPNRIVKNMFEKYERRMPGKTTQPAGPQPTQPTGPQKMLPPGQGFTMKPYHADEVIPPPPGPGVVPPERRLYGPTVDPAPSQTALPSPKAPGVIEADWTPKYSPGMKPGVFTMDGPQGRTSVDIREARKKLISMGYSVNEVDDFVTQMMKLRN